MNSKSVNVQAKAQKAEKPKKIKVVRDSFTIPKPEFEQIDALKKRALVLGVSVKKSELLRAGLLVLRSMSDTAFKAAVANVPVLKTGRPEAEKAPVASPKPVAKQPLVTKPVAKKPAPKKAVPAKRPTAKPVVKAISQPTAKRVVRKKATPAKAV